MESKNWFNQEPKVENGYIYGAKVLASSVFSKNKTFEGSDYKKYIETVRNCRAILYIWLWFL